MTTLLDRIASHASRRPESLALIDHGHAVTYGELAARVEVGAAELRRDPTTPPGWTVFPLPADAGSLIRLLTVIAAGRRPILTDPAASAAELRGAQEAVRAETAVAGPAGQRPQHPEYGLVTSGTTDVPRVVARDLEAAVVNCAAYLTMVPYRPGDRVLCAAPLHHSYGFSAGALACLLSGACLVLAGRPTASSLIATAAEHRCHIVISVPFMYSSAFVSGPPSVPSARVYLTAGDLLTAEVNAQWVRATGRQLTNHYGSTECGFITVALPGDVRTAGRPVPGVGLRTASGDGVSEGVLSVGLPAGYSRILGAPVEQGPDSGLRWIDTGDIAQIGPGGEVTLLGRADSSVTLAGNQINLTEVEGVLGRHPSVRGCKVLAVGRPVERLSAYVETDGVLDELQLRRYLSSRLASYQIPSRIHLVDQLPRTATGKIRTGRLRWQEAAES